MLPKTKFKLTAKIVKYPGPSGWYYLPVSEQDYQSYKLYGERGLVAINLSYKKDTWQTSVLPLGNGLGMIPLKAAVRKKYALDENQTITISYTLRER